MSEDREQRVELRQLTAYVPEGKQEEGQGVREAAEKLLRSYDVTRFEGHTSQAAYRSEAIAELRAALSSSTPSQGLVGREMCTTHPDRPANAFTAYCSECWQQERNRSSSLAAYSDSTPIPDEEFIGGLDSTPPERCPTCKSDDPNVRECVHPTLGVFHCKEGCCPGPFHGSREES